MIEKRPSKCQKRRLHQIVIQYISRINALKFHQFCYDYQLSKSDAFEILMSVLPYELKEIPTKKNTPFGIDERRFKKKIVRVAKRKYTKLQTDKVIDFFNSMKSLDRQKGRRELVFSRFYAHCKVLKKNPRIEVIKMLKDYLKGQY